MGYYFISVGGSGSRVLEAMTHLSVAGLLPNLERRGHIYVMAIDPDTGNGNLARTHTLLNCINNFQNVNVGTNTPLLKTPLKLANPFVWSPTKLDRNLDDIIAYHTYRNSSIGKLYKSLFTEQERLTILNEGFRGRPSIGAAVMSSKAMIDGAASVSQETAWLNLINTVRADVKINGSAKIFLAGSIFGGTGAAGLPTIVRILRDIFQLNFQRGEVSIGAALLLPYFSFSPTPQEIQNSGLFASSESFLTNSKAALHYYADTSGAGYDNIYFIGDETMLNMPKFSVGAASQCNDAHIVDFFAAQAALHFFHAATSKHCYYISRNQDPTFQWNDFPNVLMQDDTTVSVHDRFVQFTRFLFAYLHLIKPVYQDIEDGKLKEYNFPWYVNYLKKVKASSAEVRAFEDYAFQFFRWLDQIIHSAGARSVRIINPESFSIDDKVVTFKPTLFPTLDFGNSSLTIDEVNTGISARESKGFFDKIFGKKKNNDEDLGQDFGRFLRRLYDCCRIESK